MLLWTVLLYSPDRFHTDRFSRKKWKSLEGKEEWHVEIWNRFKALENLDNEVDINSDWESVRANISI
jgi:hypothetical protein